MLPISAATLLNIAISVPPASMDSRPSRGRNVLTVPHLGHWPTDMAEVLLFHHAHGITDGFLAFADELRAAGHVVRTPDLFEGNTFASLADGVGFAKRVGFDTILERGRAAAEGLPTETVYTGFSLGGLPAQMLAQTRPGSRGALLFHSCLPVSEFGTSWPDGVPVQIHIMEGDEWAQEGDLDAARELVATADRAELFLYPGDRHLFADSGLPDYDPSAAALLEQRVLRFLDASDHVTAGSAAGT